MVAFFERVQSAEEMADDVDGADSLDVQTANVLQRSVLEGGSNWCKVLHSGLDRDDRQTMLAEFKSTKVAALLACRILDEGIDDPNISAELLVASTQSKRQRIQRIGRALRRGDGQKRPLIITLFVPETNDRNVTQGDASVFGSAATIHHVTEEGCLPTVRHLLNRS